MSAGDLDGLGVEHAAVVEAVHEQARSSGRTDQLRAAVLAPSARPAGAGEGEPGAAGVGPHTSAAGWPCPVEVAGSPPAPGRPRASVVQQPVAASVADQGHPVAGAAVAVEGRGRPNPPARSWSTRRGPDRRAAPPAPRGDLTLLHGLGAPTPARKTSGVRHALARHHRVLARSHVAGAPALGAAAGGPGTRWPCTGRHVGEPSRRHVAVPGGGVTALRAGEEDAVHVARVQRPLTRRPVGRRHRRRPPASVSQ